MIRGSPLGGLKRGAFTFKYARSDNEPVPGTPGAADTSTPLPRPQCQNNLLDECNEMLYKRATARKIRQIARIRSYVTRGKRR